MEETPELAAFTTLFDRAQIGLKFEHELARTGRKYLRGLRRAQGARRWMIFIELLQLLVENLDSHATPLAGAGYTHAIGMDSSERMRRTCQIILQRFDESLRHEDVAAELNLSPAYFSRLFKKTTRRTYTAFFTEVRLGHACRLLTETHQSGVDIAFHSGFRNFSNFNRRFKNAYGCAPREYRKQHLQPGGRKIEGTDRKGS